MNVFILVSPSHAFPGQWIWSIVDATGRTRDCGDRPYATERLAREEAELAVRRLVDGTDTELVECEMVTEEAGV